MKPDGLSAEIDRILNEEYGLKFTNELDEASRKAAQFGRRTVKDKSPVDSGKYAKGWGYKKINEGRFEVKYKVYNKSRPSLTHLLEKGHAVKNQFGSYNKRTRAYPHIFPTQDETNEKYIELVTNMIKGGFR